MRHRQPRPIGLAIVACLFVGACGAPDSEETPPATESAPPITDAAPVDGGPDDQMDIEASEIEAVLATDIVPLDAHDQELVTLEARWLCDAQRRSFTDLGDLESARVSLLANSEVSADDYAAFQERLESDTDLRLAVLAAFQTNCAS